mgnify:CR=1 FL=1
MIDIALKHFPAEKVKKWMNTQALGVFFDSPPMCWYGDSPLGCASSRCGCPQPSLSKATVGCCM